MRTLGQIRVEELAIVLILMFFGFAGAIPGIAPNQANEMTGAAASGLQTAAGIGSQLLINGLIASLLLRHRSFLWRAREQAVWPLLLAVWAIASLLWSQDRLLTARRALPFSLAAAFGVYLAVRLSRQRFLFLLRWSFAVLAVWSAVLALGFPSIGLDASTGHGGDWQGVFTQKNACGRAMVFAMGSVLAAGWPSAGRFIVLLLFSSELVLSGSRGAWLLAAVLLAAFGAFGLSCRFDRRTRAALLLGAGAAACFLAVATVTDFSDLAPLLGRDATLTGRTAIWHEVWISITHRPLFGYGFSAFWRGAQGASWDVVVALRFVLFHAHNGFLEIWLELGAAGLFLFVLGFLRAVWLLWPELRAGRYAEAAWPLATLLLIAVYDLDENTLLSFNGLFWVLYVAALTQVERMAADRKTIARLLARSSPRTRELPGMVFRPVIVPADFDCSSAWTFRYQDRDRSAAPGQTMGVPWR